MLVDHKLPVSEGGSVLDPANIWSLCISCHAWKGRLEDHARLTGQVGQLRRWCDEPASRPAFRGDLKGKPT